MKRVIWKLTNPNAGRFLVCEEEEAERLIAAGEAQCAKTTDAKHLKRPLYKTRMVSAESSADMEAETEAKPKKRRRKRKQSDPVIPQEDTAGSAGESSDGD